MQFSNRRRGAIKTIGASLTAGASWSALAQAPAPGDAPAADAVFDKARERGSLTFGVYNDNAPFHDKGVGINVDLATALAKVLGLKASMMPFPAGENVNDDLRNMVWRGHYLGYGPADVLLHVPVDKLLIEQTPQALIFAPYCTETFMVARDKSKVAEAFKDTRQFAGHKIAVPGQTAVGWLVVGADQGAYVPNVTTRLKDAGEAVELLKKGQVTFAVGMASEIEAAIAGDPRFELDVYPGMRSGRGIWAMGMAVKKQSVQLARSLQAATNQLSESGEMAALFKKYSVVWRKP